MPLESTDRLKLVNDQSATGFYELMIAGVTPEDAGRYRCNALNRFGEIKCEADVTVTSKLTYWLHPSSRLDSIQRMLMPNAWIADEKSVFKLMNQQSLLEPGEKPVFEWYKDGAPFDPEERFKCSFQVIENVNHNLD